jgi:hypothetical protein
MLAARPDGGKGATHRPAPARARSGARHHTPVGAPPERPPQPAQAPDRRELPVAERLPQGAAEQQQAVAQARVRARGELVDGDRAQRQRRAPPVGEQQQEDGQRHVQLDKPFSPAALADRVRALLSGGA